MSSLPRYSHGKSIIVVEKSWENNVCNVCGNLVARPLYVWTLFIDSYFYDEYGKYVTCSLSMCKNNVLTQRGTCYCTKDITR